MTVRFQEMSAQQQKEIRMYGCTVAQMREAVEQSLTYRFSGPAMYAMGLMSDCQEMLHYSGEEANAREDVRQMLNRAKWILATFVMNQE
jgi:hypothetical protein